MIKFVYFDVGGVVVQDFSGTNKWEELRRELGVTPVTSQKFEEIWDTCNGIRDTVFDVDDLVPTLKKELNLTLPADYSLLMGFVNRFEKNSNIWAVIAAIQQEVPVGLLTNMYPRMLGKIYAANIMPPLEWSIVVDSSVEKIRKPDPAIFKRAEEKANLSGSDILFIDNQQGHLDAAVKGFGWQTFLHDPRRRREASEELMDYFMSNK